LSSKSNKIDKGSKTVSCNNLTQLQQRHRLSTKQGFVVCRYAPVRRTGTFLKGNKIFYFLCANKLFPVSTLTY